MIEEALPGLRRFSEATAERIDAGVKAILDAAFQRALGILETNRDILERCARELLERETLEAAELRKLTERLKCEPAPEPKAARRKSTAAE